jgi:hypothetical protein
MARQVAHLPDVELERADGAAREGLPVLRQTLREQVWRFLSNG